MQVLQKVSVDEYLDLAYTKPEPEYQHGEVRERSMPDSLHSKVQGELFYIFRQLQNSRRLYARPELRVRIAEDLLRIPDLAVYQGSEPTERFPSHPPLVAVEILSADDRVLDLLEKLDDYQLWGVKHIWVIETASARLRVYENGNVPIVPALSIPEASVTITPSDLFN